MSAAVVTAESLTSTRRILPKGDLPPELERQVQSAPADLPTKQKRKLTLSACEPCRRRKTKCDGQRPVCSACLNKSNHICTWEVNDASLSRTAALRSKIDELQSQLDKDGGQSKSMESLLGYLMTRPEREAQNILERLRTTQDIGATVQYVRDGDLLISSVLAPEPEADGAVTTEGTAIA